MYQFVCPSCENIHDIKHIENPGLPERQCEGCGDNGCIDCMPDDWCEECDWEDASDEWDADDPYDRDDPSLP